MEYQTVDNRQGIQNEIIEGRNAVMEALLQ